jgi:hypothetical protein
VVDLQIRVFVGIENRPVDTGLFKSKSIGDDSANNSWNFSDEPVAMKRIGMVSKSGAKRAINDIESLRNHLAHAQDIVQHDWPQIARLNMRLEETVRG